MANLDRPFGLRPVRGPNGSMWSGEANLYVVLGADTGDYRIGDVVMPGGSADAFGIPSAIKYAAGGTGATAPLGAVVGVHPVNPRNTSLVGTSLALESKTLTGSILTDRYIMVTDHYDMVYEVQADSTGLRRDSVGSNVDVTVTAPGNDNQFSATVLNGGTDANTSTLPYRIIGFSSEPDNEISGTAGTDVPFIRTLVRPNEHAWKVGVIGLAV